MDISESFSELNTSEEGLTKEEVMERREKYGLNELREEEKETIWDIIVDQFKDILIWILIFAAIVSGINKEIKESILIIVILILNAIFGTYQEWKADKAIEALKEMTEFECKVLRDGEVIEIPSKYLVPGDIIITKQGDRIPADARLFSTKTMRIEEASLTGESTAVAKNHEIVLDENTTLADRKNMAFMGTFVTKGQGKAIVVRTGMDTEMGQIAESVQLIKDEKTPFQKKVEYFGKNLGIGILILSGLIIIIGTFLTPQSFLDMLTIGVSLAVAAIPEGLPIIITLVLALGVQKMAKQNAIVKKLPVVESLGSATVICTDKTGTLTKNKMTVVESVIFDTDGEITVSNENKFQIQNINAFDLMYQCGVYCNNANILNENDVGDATEKAIMREAKARNYDIEKMLDTSKRIDEIPFDSSRKRMNVLIERNGKKIAFVKGAPDVIIQLVSHVKMKDGVKEITDNLKQRMMKKMEDMGEDALRVLGFAYKELKEDGTIEETDEDLVFLGYMGMIDPAKEGVKEAIEACYTAGIKVMMLTGDHKITASAIGKEVGLEITDESVLTGRELDTISDEDLVEIVKKVNVFARISPSHKLRIVSALKENNEIVAMTGDGVNDAPALKGSDIGISMGIAGTDVTKETADMILADDNFATIVLAVKEGRAIFDNMSRFIRYMLSSNVAEISVVFLALIFGWSIPLVAVQILFINLVTDGFPALAMSAEPHEKNIMNRKPKDTDKPLLDNHTTLYIIRISMYITFATLLVYWLADFNNDQLRASTMAFSTLVIAQLFNALNLRHKERSILNRSIFDNMILFVVIIGSLIFQVFIVHGDVLLQFLFGITTNPINDTFHTTAIRFSDWVLIFVFSIGTLFYEELFKLVNRTIGIQQKLPDVSISVDSK